jgi:hypothetical protein
MKLTEAKVSLSSVKERMEIKENIQTGAWEPFKGVSFLAIVD